MGHRNADEEEAWESLEGQEEEAGQLVPSIETSQRIEYCG
jgi:hypothetical protein